MEPATHAVAFESPPTDLLERLQPVLAAQGSPAITATQENGRLVFACDTGPFMLRARVIQALTDVWPGWQDAPASVG